MVGLEHFFWFYSLNLMTKHGLRGLPLTKALTYPPHISQYWHRRLMVSSFTLKSKRENTAQQFKGKTWTHITTAPKEASVTIWPNGWRDQCHPERSSDLIKVAGPEARLRLDPVSSSLSSALSTTPSCPLNSPMVIKSKVHDLCELWMLMTANCIFIDAKIKKNTACFSY